MAGLAARGPGKQCPSQPFWQLANPEAFFTSSRMPDEAAGDAPVEPKAADSEPEQKEADPDPEPEQKEAEKEEEEPQKEEEPRRPVKLASIRKHHTTGADRGYEK